MPTYNVQVTVNVPGAGQKTFTAVALQADSLEEAIVQAKAQITVRVTLVTETAP